MKLCTVVTMVASEPNSHPETDTFGDSHNIDVNAKLKSLADKQIAYVNTSILPASSEFYAEIITQIFYEDI